MRRGQAMLETVLAIVFLTFVFFGIYRLSRMVAARILLDHAAARAARAKAVGFNDYMCLKSARVAMIPVAGRRVWPADIFGGDEAARVPIYLESGHEARARAILDYEKWHSMNFNVEASEGIGAAARSNLRLADDEFKITGEAEVEAHYPFYMTNQGF